MKRAEDVAGYRNALTRWYRKHARDLPWRRDPRPYPVWVSEIMLQQTRVEAVREHYARFLERFPTVEALAAAPLEDVLEAWSGLGYYRRARNLHAGAKAVVERHGGAFPRDEAEALALPGIGRYTAGAIRSIAYGERAPILDGNVMRVLCRVFGIDGVPTKGDVAKRLWALAAEAVERGDPSEVNQAQMELGALVCLPREPKCGVCPLAKQCVALAEGRTAELPQAAPKRATVDLVRAVLLVRDGDRVLLRRRGDDEPSPGLWDLPGAFEGNDSVTETTPLQVAGTLPLAVEVGERIATVKHAVTYRRIRLDVYEAEARGDTRLPAKGRGEAGGAEFRWNEPDEALQRALPGPARRILRAHVREGRPAR